MPVAVAHNADAEGRAAVAAALDWAQVHDTTLLVLHVQDTGRDGASGTPADAAEVTAVAKDVEDVIGERGGPTAPQWKVVSTTSASEVPSALLRLCAEHDAEVLVIGSRRRSEVGKFFLGGTTQRILLDSPIPVLVVKGPEALSRPFVVAARATVD
ncbi:universal stress protein [Ornithinimicrobium murale]|uniref:universal stress protein n=1 Tax=Ornithinimicrobium murale TaxID=1050153 RepID=UPI000E0DDC51|nr:universal stress protein [Ornithinimicrobium murale]